ncbi:nucleotide pyrophosphohydrolase [Acidovorax sp. sic0104]|nr:nucleotide pyrophosphohydrolase [Acidovorax sp. sic0104]
MDLKALQARLRDFAAARDWRSFHSPKNLAMALMVEAAELLELFQWLTTEQSNTLTRNAADKERVGDEIADVLLYLLQLADCTGVDVEDAVERKMRKNAEKYPAKHPEKAAPGPKGHLLIDWENVQPSGEELRELVPQGTDVWLFHGPRQKVDASSHLQAYGPSRVTLIPRPDVTKKNALDFQLSYYIGYISARQPQERFVVVSNDTGYDPMLEHARELGFDAWRCEVRKLPRVAKSKPSAMPPEIPALDPVPADVQPASSAIEAALVQQLAENAGSNLRFIPLAKRPREQDAVLAYFRLFIAQDVKDKDGLARSAWKLLVDRGDLLAQQFVLPVPPQPALPKVAATAKKAALAAPVEQATPPSPMRSKSTTKGLALARNSSSTSSSKATRQDVQRLAELLQTMPLVQRPVRKDALLALLQVFLGEIGAVSPRVAGALAQLQALKHVVLKGNGVSYPAGPAAPKKHVAPAQKMATPTKTTPDKVAPQPKAAQIAQAVLASLKKMPKNRPTRRTGLLKFIETHATRAADPKAMAQLVCTLLEARKEVAPSLGGSGLIYPKLQGKKASSD